MTFRHVLSEGEVLEKSQAEVIIYSAVQNESGFIFLKDVIALETRIPAQNRPETGDASTETVAVTRPWSREAYCIKGWPFAHTPHYKPASSPFPSFVHPLSWTWAAASDRNGGAGAVDFGRWTSAAHYLLHSLAPLRPSPVFVERGWGKKRGGCRY